MRSLRKLIPFLFLTIAFACSNLQAEAPVSLWDLKPVPGLKAYAEQNGIAIQGIDLTTEATASLPGDEVVYLLMLQQPSGQKQWLVRLVADMPDHRKGETKPLQDDTIFTSTGLELRYTHQPAALNIEFIGPFDANTPGSAQIQTRRGRTVVSAESLEAGLFRYCESSVSISSRLKAAGVANPVYYGSGGRPRPDAIAAGRKAAAAFQLTADEERVAFSVYFALLAFYKAASEIPACNDVLEQVVQKPSLWSLASNLGVSTNFEYGWQEVIRLPDGMMPVARPVYVLPVKLAFNGRPALKVSLSVTTTEPPLRHCAGIGSLVAEHPTDPRKLLYMTLLSARSGKQR
jgi:hypothetical protein